ncbi:HlyD family efflux transporter periplasmic adaptor subunit [uncultured Desulfobulbus sp.]|uniref:HlyD family efflux transporter periplasmic adaptor subunit n=1 Tax=uncultured Desulfobulbus sp. TaxID=239745 RepID=UPI002631B6DA|nr:HlyD family efflux transporter periplasmic adaptor subunit [uncultured Desulfobulbus sp.]
MRFSPVRSTLAALIMAALVLSACSDDRRSGDRSAPLTLYGNVDIREVQLAFQDAGRIRALPVDEGARVAAGQVVAELDPTRYQLELQRLNGEVAAQTQVLARLRQGSRPQEVARARAAAASARASLADAATQLARKQQLRTVNRISVQEVDTARTRVETLQANLKAAEEEVSLVVEGPRQEDIAAAEASLAALAAARDLAAQRLEDTRLLAPAAGVIRTRILEPGAMAAPGAPVFTLALTDPLWVRAYISEPDLGLVHEGMRAEVRTDTLPDKTYQGWVGFISSTAEFTPKTVETTELRTKLVYRARIFVCDPQEELRLGMPVTVTLQPGARPESAPAPSCGPDPQPGS